MESIKLNDGYSIPQLGYGVFTITDHEECKKCVLQALETGYRHIDTAQVYLNEAAVGDAIEESPVDRKDIYITSKIWVTSFGYKKAKKQIDVALKKLKTDYIDLMLLHRPFGDYKGAWKALEEAVKAGKIRSIGLSNFTQKQTQEILDIAEIKPVINQIELHPFGQQKAMRKYLAENGIAVESWFPLGHGDKKLLNLPLFGELASKYKKSPAQIIIKWHIQSGLIVFPRAKSRHHMKDNFEVFDFEISAEDMQRISDMDEDKYYDTVPMWIQKITSRFQKC